jgi:hypothetical protein
MDLSFGIRGCKPLFVATQPVLDALNLSNSSPSEFASVEDIQHFTNVFASDCLVVIALCALYCLADAAENSRLAGGALI